MPDNDAFDLNRFIDAQAPVYHGAVRELRQGRKTSHWMWFIFPQIKGLGSSETSRKYAISSIQEARAYLARPVLGPRLRECCTILLHGGSTSAERIFGSIDAMKLRSSMTLFREASAPDSDSPFQDVLDRFFGGEADPETLALISRI